MVLCIAMLLSMVAMLCGCDPKSTSNQTDTFVIMTDQLDGLFNPFYSTSANDGSIVGMTQIGMLGADYVNGEIKVAYGDNESVVAKDYAIVPREDGSDYVDYFFVIKNGIKFSDGHPLTMEDVLFNYYVYLDPVYTGSSTLYSTDILGLEEYRTQQSLSGSGSGGSAAINSAAAAAAKVRLLELINLFTASLKVSTSKAMPPAAMEQAIKDHVLSDGYKGAISNNPAEVTNDQLLADYRHALELFKEELGRDWNSAQESYTDAPYDSDYVKIISIIFWGERNNMAKAEYRSSIRSKNLIKKAVAKLIHEKELSKITVSDVIREADISRGTFYAHFPDIQSVVEQIETEEVKKLVNLVNLTQTEKSSVDSTKAFLSAVFNHLYNDFEYYGNLIQSCFLNNYLNRIVDIYYSQTFSKLLEKDKTKNENSANIYLTFTTYGVKEVIIAWLQGRIDCSPNELAEKISTLLELCNGFYK